MGQVVPKLDGGKNNASKATKNARRGMLQNANGRRDPQLHSAGIFTFLSDGKLSDLIIAFLFYDGDVKIYSEDVTHLSSQSSYF